MKSAFIAERQILDGPLILNEVLSCCNYKKKRTMRLISKKHSIRLDGIFWMIFFTNLGSVLGGVDG